MHNTPIANLEYQITSNETNLRYLAGNIPPDKKLLAEHQANIEQLKIKLAELKKPVDILPSVK